MEELRAMIMESLAQEFGIKPDTETGEYDIGEYDWTSGCHFKDGKWLTLANIVYWAENFIDYYYDDIVDAMED